MNKVDFIFKQLFHTSNSIISADFPKIPKGSKNDELEIKVK